MPLGVLLHLAGDLMPHEDIFDRRFEIGSAAGRCSCVRGGGADEAPEVYKHLPDVLAAHGDTILVKHTLRPVGVAMAGRDIYDPYKD